MTVSFDLFLQRFSHGDLAPIDRDAVRAVLATARHRDVLGAWVVETANGGSTELFAGGLDGNEEFTGCFFPLRRFTPRVLDFIVRIAQAGDIECLPDRVGDDAQVG